MCPREAIRDFCIGFCKNMGYAKGIAYNLNRFGLYLGGKRPGTQQKRQSKQVDFVHGFGTLFYRHLFQNWVVFSGGDEDHRFGG